MSRIIAIAALAAALGACASGPTENSIQTGVHCVAMQMVPITVGEAVYFVPGHCTRWEVGPTPQERKDFERRHGIDGAAAPAPARVRRQLLAGSCRATEFAGAARAARGGVPQ